METIVEVEEIDIETMELQEELYIGNLHHMSRHHHNNHCWTMFLSTSPTDVVSPKTVKSVKYYLHQTFNPNTVTVLEPPFYLDRRGWGYFDVTADITFKSEYFLKTLTAVHSIHFGQPLLTHHIQTNLPYTINSAKLQKNVTDQADTRAVNRLRRRRRELTRTANASRNNDERKQEDEKQPDIDVDLITKQYIPEFVYNGFSMTKKQLQQILNNCMGTITPQEVISLIIDYVCICSIGNASNPNELINTRVILKNCFAIEFVVYCAVLELVVINCGGCEIQYSNIERSVRVYNSKVINLYNKGECTSYRFEKCDRINVEALDIRKQVIFMSIFSNDLCFKMFNAYFPNDSSKCVAEFPQTLQQDIDETKQTDKNNDNSIDGNNEQKKKVVKAVTHDECYLTIFRKDIDYAAFGSKSVFSTGQGTTLIPFT
eukprot:51874_1